MFRGMTLCEAEERREAKSKEVECLMAMSLMNLDWIGLTIEPCWFGIATRHAFQVEGIKLDQDRKSFT